MSVSQLRKPTGNLETPSRSGPFNRKPMDFRRAVHFGTSQVMGIPLSLMAIMGGRDVWITGDRFIEYGYISDPLVAEAIERRVT